MVVSSALEDNDYALISVVPHTTSGRGARFEIDLKAPRLKPGTFNLQALQPVSLRRFQRLMSELTDEQMNELDSVIRRWLSF